MIGFTMNKAFVSKTFITWSLLVLFLLPTSSPTRIGSVKGEHVINNGVRKVYKKIVDSFLEEFAKRYALPKDVKETLGHLEMFRDAAKPLPQDVDNAIEKVMVYHLRPGDKYNNYNAVAFGPELSRVQNSVVKYMLMVYVKKISKDGGVRHVGPINREKSKLRQTIANFLRGESYIDHEILPLWRRNKNEVDLRMYERSKNAVRAMFMELADFKNKVSNWVDEFYRALSSRN